MVITDTMDLVINQTYSDECNLTQLDSVTYVGPSETHELLGWWSISMFGILFLHVLPVWIYSAICWWRLGTGTRSSSHSLKYLMSLPFLLVTVSALGILFPFIGKYSETLLEIIISFGIVQYVQYVTLEMGGLSQLISFCQSHNILYNLGSPPFICFMPLKQPTPSKFLMSVAKWGPIMLFCVKISILSVDIIYILLNYHPSGWYLDVDNIHYVISIPAGLFGIYFYNIYLGIFSEVLKNSSKRHLGPIILMEFILFDVLRIFFVFLAGTGMLNCLPPYYSVETVTHLLKNCMKAFLATWIGLPFLRFCSTEEDISNNTEVLKSPSDEVESDVINHNVHDKVVTELKSTLDNLAFVSEEE